MPINIDSDLGLRNNLMKSEYNIRKIVSVQLMRMSGKMCNIKGGEL